MNFREMRKTSKESIFLELAPMIDIVFLLLIFFMVTTTFSEAETGINIKLPESTTKDIVETRQIIISITRNKEIYINTKKVNIYNFESILRRTLKSVRKAHVIIRGDRNINYGFVVKVMTISKRAGVKIMDIATELVDGEE